MIGKKSEKSIAPDNPEKAPEEWVTGDETMTGPQKSYLETLCREAGEEFDPTLSKAEASRRIDNSNKRLGAAATIERTLTSPSVSRTLISLLGRLFAVLLFAAGFLSPRQLGLVYGGPGLAANISR
jgi:hypothetical protein